MLLSRKSKREEYIQNKGHVGGRSFNRAAKKNVARLTSNDGI